MKWIIVFLYLIAIISVRGQNTYNLGTESDSALYDLDQLTSTELSLHLNILQKDSSILLDTETLKIQQISDASYIHTSYLQTKNWGKVGCNGLIVNDDGEVVVVDTPIDNEVSQELIKWINDNLGSKIIAVVPTHFHVDCLGGLKAFHDDGVRSIFNQHTQDLSEVQASVTFEHQYEIEVGGEKVILFYPGEGHTNDNIVAYFEKDSVLFGGCLLKSIGAVKGNLADANVKTWATSVAHVRSMFPSIQHVVPGHGKVGGEDLLDFTIRLFEDPIIIDEEGNNIDLKNHPGLAIQAIYSVEANENRAISYSINQYQNDFKSISILEKNKLVFEFISSANSQNIDLEKIKERRKEWIMLCNKHNAQGLVEELYSSDAIYYNHKPVIRGHASIIADYAYMNNPEYSLHLEPLTIVPVNDHMVFEIGQCSGSYKGKYILVWKKEKDGEWRIFMDSNI